MPCLIFILPSPHMIYKFFSLCYNEFNTFLGGVEMTTNVDLEKLQKDAVEFRISMGAWRRRMYLWCTRRSNDVYRIFLRT